MVQTTPGLSAGLLLLSCKQTRYTSPFLALTLTETGFMGSSRLLGFPTWFWRALIVSSLVMAAIVLQPWCDPILLVEDVPQLADEYLEHQHLHPSSTTVRLPWLVGLLNQLGVLAFCCAGVVALFVACFLTQRQL